MGDAAGSAGLGQRLRAAAVTVGLVLVVPMVAAGLVVGLPAAVAAALGAAFSLLLALRTGWRRALVGLPLLLAALAGGALSAGTPGWVVLLGSLGLAAGLLSMAGLLVPLALAGVLASTTPILDAADGLAGQVVVAGVAGLYALAVARGLGVPAVVPGFAVPRRYAILLAGVLGVVAAVASALAVRSGDPHSYWLPATVFLLVLPSPGLRVSDHARQRVLGTAVAVVALVPVALLEPPDGVRFGLAAAALVLVFAVPDPVWVNAGLSTVVIVLLLDPTGGGLEAGGNRIVDVALASALVLAGAALVSWAGGRMPGAAEQKELAADTVAAQTRT